jgi:hypothetical protein
MNPSDHTISSRLRLIQSQLDGSHPNIPDLLNNFLAAVDSQDPNLFHFEISRKTLSLLDLRYSTNENAIDRLARDFLNHCRKLKESYLLSPDHYLKLLSSIGKTGRSEAKQLLPKLERTDHSFWILPKKKQTHLFIILQPSSF